MTRGALPRRDCRYQAAIIEDGNVLLLRVRDPHSDRSFWLVPGGGREGSECEEACVRREVREETGLTVEVDRLLWEEEVPTDAVYRRTKTYLCRVTDGVAAVGSEPEVDGAEHHVIEDIGWFPLERPELWGPEIDHNAITSKFLIRLSRELASTTPS